MMEKKDMRLSVLLVLVLFMAQIFTPFVVAQAQSEGNGTAMDGNLTLSANVSENTALNTSYGGIKRNRITFVLGTDENLLSLFNASIDAAVNTTIEVMIYNATEAKSANFNNEGVVFLASLDNETVASISHTLNRSADVFVYNLTTNISIGTVADINITKYWVYGGDENIQNLINYMDNKFYGNTTGVDPPKPPENRTKIAFVVSYLKLYFENAKDNPYISKYINVTTIYEELPEDVDLSDQNVIMVIHSMGETLNAIRGTMDEAKDSGAHIIVYQTIDFYNWGNVDLSDPDYSNIRKYWDNCGEENVKRLITFLGVKFCNVNMEILPPVPRPLFGLYHPDAEVAGVGIHGMGAFRSTNEYLEWYTASGKYNPFNSTIGVIVYELPTSDLHYDRVKVPAVIRALEKKGVNVITASYCSYDPNCTKYFVVNNTSVVDAVISLKMSRFHYPNASEGIEYLKKVNTTVLHGIGAYYTNISEWNESKHGISPAELGFNILQPELDGVIEHVYIAGRALNPWGSDYYYVPIQSQVDWLADRAISWAKLHRMNNSDKKIAVTYYSEGGGKANLGADADAYLDAQASLENLLKAMKEKGYDLGSEPLPNKTEISKLMIEKGKNVGTWAPSELKNMVENDSVVLIPETKYREWFNQLPENRREEVIAQWGEPPGDVMAYKNETGRYIAIPMMKFGKVLIAPHPTWGRLQNKSVMYCERSTPPHHQYIAFYMYLEKEFGADAIFQIFGQASILPGKETGLSRYDWPCLMVQDMPCVGACTVEDPLGAANVKRRGFVYPIDFMTPPIVAAGLYGDLSTLEEKIVEYRQVTNPEVKREYRNSIIELCRDLHIDHDLSVDLNETIGNGTKLDIFIEDVYDYLRGIKNEYMPYGLHTLSEPPTNESLVGMVESMLGDEFKNNVSVINSSEGVTTRLLTEVLLNGLSPENAQNKVIGTVSLGITQDLNLAVEYSNTIDACKIEIPRILDALEGKYIPPGPCGDPVRDPTVLPTGRNPVGFNPDKIPTKEAWEVGKILGDQLLALHLNKTGEYPPKVGFVLWAWAMGNHGVTESEILYLMGVRPIWSPYGSVKDVELINSSELNRPRIDVIVVPSGLCRDLFPSRLALLDKAVRLAAQANDTEYPNYVKEHTESLYQDLIAEGYNESVAKELSTIRVFSEAPGSYATGLQDAIPSSNTWEDTNKLADLYIGRESYVCGREELCGEHFKELLKKNLNGVEIGVFNRESNVWGLLDHIECACYFGGFGLAVKSVSGKAPDMYINNLRELNNPRVETLSQFFNRELRTRYFNPKWIQGMMDHDYGGVVSINQFTEDLWAWQVTTPDLITEDMWNQVYDVYVQDKYDLGLNEFFDSNNPYAQQSITARMLETIRKGYWDPPEDIKTTLAETYQKSVEEYGVTCCHHTCGNLLLQDYMQGIVSASALEQSTEQSTYSSGGGGGSWSRRSTETETEAETETEPDKGVINATETTGVSKLGEELKKPPEKTADEKRGKVMKEEKPAEEASPAFPISGAPLMGIIAVIVALVLIGIGLGYKRRRR